MELFSPVFMLWNSGTFLNITKLRSQEVDSHLEWNEILMKGLDLTPCPPLPQMLKYRINYI